MLANPAAAGRVVLAVTGLIAAAKNEAKQTQRLKNNTEEVMAKPNQSPEQMANLQNQLMEELAKNEAKGVTKDRLQTAAKLFRDGVRILQKAKYSGRR